MPKRKPGNYYVGSLSFATGCLGYSLADGDERYAHTSGRLLDRASRREPYRETYLNEVNFTTGCNGMGVIGYLLASRCVGPDHKGFLIRQVYFTLEKKKCLLLSTRHED